MIGHNYTDINKSANPNNLTDFFNPAGCIYEKKDPHSQDKVDTDIHTLSSRKLWQILKLNQIRGCELDAQFVTQVKQELRQRNDFDNGQAWCEPH